MRTFFVRLRHAIRSHKGITTLVVLAIVGGGSAAYRSLTSATAETRYVLAAAERGTIVSSVTASGQVSASNQIDLKPKASGEALAVAVQNGQPVRAGQLIVQLDSQDAAKAVRDAETNLESARIALEKLRKPADQLSILQAQNSLAQAQESKQNAEDALVQSYDAAFSATANAFLDLPAVMTGLHDMLYTTTINPSSGQWNLDYYTNVAAPYDIRIQQYRDDANLKYRDARTAYDRTFQNYKSASRFSPPSVLEPLLNETYETTKAIAEAVKSANNFIQFYEDTLANQALKPIAAADAHLATLNSSTGKTNSHLTALLSAKNAIQNNRDAITNAERSIAERTESLAKLTAGPDALDIASQELAVRQRENALQDAREKLADYALRAPFDATIAKLTIKKSDAVSPATTVATLITKQKIAEVSLNEVDVTKVRVGQKATLTFDAVPGLTITGEVAEVDAVGTVAQGVVTYGVKIAFDTQDDRVKPGMSVAAAVVTDIKQNVLAVPNGAVKSQGGTYYAEIVTGQPSGSAATPNPAGVPSSTPPSRRTVTIGVANDTATEIVDGLSEGDWVVVRTVTSGNSGASPSQSQQTSGLRLFGAPTGGTRNASPQR